jgi:hypothetical protein
VRVVRLVRDLALSLLFVTRNSIWQVLFSCSFERAIAYHRWISNTVLELLTFSFSFSLSLWARLRFRSCTKALRFFRSSAP